MTPDEKAAAFDALALALTNRWHDGTWTWWSPCPCGSSEPRASRDEAVADLVVWAEGMATKRLARGCVVDVKDRLAGHEGDYDPPDAWRGYTDEELRQWVALLTKRALMRVPGPKRDKDLADAANYQAMLDSRAVAP